MKTKLKEWFPNFADFKKWTFAEHIVSFLAFMFVAIGLIYALFL